MNKQDISNIKQLLSTKKNIIIVPHKNPDGDAIGSCLGLYHFLLKHKHNVQIITPNDYPDFLKWIPKQLIRRFWPMKVPLIQNRKPKPNR